MALTVASVIAAMIFLVGLRNESFADEYAYLSQAYFTDLFTPGKVDDPAWLEQPAYDLPPLPKYVIGLSLHAAGIPFPRKETAFIWYHRDINSRFGTPEALTAARIPIALFGVMGCLGLYSIGRQAFNKRAGFVAFFLLAINPLYGLLASRAMSDVPCEALGMVALAFGLAAWTRALSSDRRVWTIVLACVLTGLFVGLALLCKFSALLVPMVLAAWGVMGLLPQGREGRGASRLLFPAGMVLAAFLTVVLFVWLNPFMRVQVTRPLPAEMVQLNQMNLWQRFKFQMDLRQQVSQGQQLGFPHNALTTPLERVKVVFVQGFGRFGPFGKHGWSSAEKTSERRYEWNQDWGAVIWGPLVIGGFLMTCWVGWRQYRAGEVSTGWAVAIWAIITFGVVTLYIPMAWDRYLLPIQGVSALLVALLISHIWDWGTRRWRTTSGGTEA